VNTKPTNYSSEFGAIQTQEYKAYQEFIRCSYVNVYTRVNEQAYLSYFQEHEIHSQNVEETCETAEAILDNLPMYQLKAWSIRNLRRLKYSQPHLGIDTMVAAQSDKLVPELNALTADAGDNLVLNPDLEMPDYFKWVDFHQQPGGVWREDFDGLVYDYGRRTTNPNHVDPNEVYYSLWEQLPENKNYNRVLDWGTGHGGGIIEWMRRNPASEGYGVDLAAPCLKLAHVRAREAGVKVKFSQQDIASMNYKDGFFDMVFHMYMLHELPQNVTPDLFREVSRVLKPGGLFIGMELALIPDEPVQHVMQFTDCWLNNEPYMAASVQADYPKIARASGFSKAEAVEAKSNRSALGKVSGRSPPRTTWNYYIFEK